VGVILAAAEGGLSLEELYADVLVPFLASVGQAWQEGRAAVWEEHLIVGAVRTAIEALYPRVLEQKARVEAVPVTVAFFCPPEETHDIGLRMLSDRFDLAGFRTVYVGALTPTVQMIECARSVDADVICLSASTHYQRATLFDVVKALSRELPHVRIVAGGPAFARSGGGWEEYLVDSVDRLIRDLRATAAGAADAAAGGAPGPGEAAGAGGPADEGRVADA
jgi:methanogenic corrinoid protein MtbC1